MIKVSAPVLRVQSAPTAQLQQWSLQFRQERYDLTYRIRKKELSVRTSNLNQVPLQVEVLVLGGGVAGCAASVALARKGRVVTLD